MRTSRPSFHIDIPDDNIGQASIFKTDLSLQKNEIMVQQIRHNTDFFKESPHKGDVYSMDQQFLSDLSAQIDSAKPSMPKAKIAVTPKPETYESEP